MDELKSAADPAVVGFPAGRILSFGFRRAQRRDRRTAGGRRSCRSRRCWPVLYSLAGMLVYLGFRFEWIYGVAAVVTVFPRHPDHGGRVLAEQ